MVFVFSVCRLVSRRCHIISTLHQLSPAPLRTVRALLTHTAPQTVIHNFRCYAQQFRFHRFSASVFGRCLPTSLDHLSSPSLQRRCPPSMVLLDDPTPCRPFASLPFCGCLAYSRRLPPRHTSAWSCLQKQLQGCGVPGIRNSLTGLLSKNSRRQFPSSIPAPVSGIRDSDAHARDYRTHDKNSPR